MYLICSIDNRDGQLGTHSIYNFFRTIISKLKIYTSLPKTSNDRDIKTIQELLGRSLMQATENYTHVDLKSFKLIQILKQAMKSLCFSKKYLDDSLVVIYERKQLCYY